MDTVTRAPMAIVQAEEGGIGIIDRGFRPGEIEPQVREVEIVKRTQHGVIRDPWSIAPDASLDEAAALMARTRVGTLVVVDESRPAGRAADRARHAVRDAPGIARRRSDDAARPAGRPRGTDRAGRGRAHHGRAEDQEAAARRPATARLIGLITARDLVRQRRMPFATRDSQGRLRVGAAIGATGDYLERAGGARFARTSTSSSSTSPTATRS